ncbi:hypothetical protein BTM25_36880 [Actinomadura rubteroloni]|uniref:DUF1707 domain-containing protein n=1 Tax=Actinomadura rubteroloni TaxID=1926885 RepID=A0A2P4UJ41_9ACTN|nr:hypothetical protein [Actinomadura rubteroloni]POM25046.1 hypothetical protein BTM25_36880 [Actinomadura rubteroloni]
MRRVGWVLVLALAGCGTQHAGAPPASPSPSPSAASPYVEPGVVDGAPHEGENGAPRRAREMSDADARAARRAVARVRPVLERLRRDGRIAPGDVRTALLGLFPAADVTVGRAQQRSAPTPPPGAEYGVRIGTTGCVTGAVGVARVWADANGLYPETGCLPPAFAH